MRTQANLYVTVICYSREPKYNIPTLITALKHCESIGKGKQLHFIAVEHNLETNTYVANTLMSMYIKCGSLSEARKLFDKMPCHDAASWTIIICGYVEKGQGELALQLFERMIPEGCSPDARTYVAALKACTSIISSEPEAEEHENGCKAWALEKGMEIHSRAVASSSGDLDIFISNTLIDMYSNCGRLDNSKQVFDSIRQPDVVSWNAMILGYSENGKPELAWKLFERMRQEADYQPDSWTFVAALKACSTLAGAEEGQQLLNSGVVKVGALEKGMAIHSQASRAGREKDIFVTSILVDVYAKCGDLTDAQTVFDRMERYNQVSWNALMLGYAENNQGDSTLELFTLMQRQRAPSSRPNGRSFVAALKGCSSLAVAEDGVEVGGGGEHFKLKSLEKGMKIHSQAIWSGFDSSMFVASTLVDMYGKCGSLLDARVVFNRMPLHDVVAWNALILVHAENKNEELALELFVRSTSTCQPNLRTYVAALKACAGLADTEVGCHLDGTVVKLHSLERGMAIHKLQRDDGSEPDPFLLSTMVDFYAKCGSMSDASRAFGELTRSRHHVICWNTLIQGYVDNGSGELALEVYSCMQREQGRCSANAHTYTAALKACSSVLALETGKGVQADICSSGIELEPVVANGLVEFYGKCSCMVGARQVFETLPSVDLPTWNGMLAGYSRAGHTELVFQTFQTLQEEQQPDSVTLVYVLAACNHAGLLHQGKELFHRVAGLEFRFRPSIEHYHCMVDILGRGNELEEALTLVKSMPHEPSPVSWITLLGACWKSRNMTVGKVAFRQLVEMDPSYASSSAAYSLMANICELEGSVDSSSRRDELNVFWSELKSAR